MSPDTEHSTIAVLDDHSECRIAMVLSKCLSYKIIADDPDNVVDVYRGQTVESQLAVNLLNAAVNTSAYVVACDCTPNKSNDRHQAPLARRRRRALDND